MHVRIDTARECQTIFCIEDNLCALGLNVGSELSDLSIFDHNIEAIDRRLVGANHAGVLDHEVEGLFHTRIPCVTAIIFDVVVQ
jgi:hypothetical protein